MKTGLELLNSVPMPPRRKPGVYMFVDVATLALQNGWRRDDEHPVASWHGHTPETTATFVHRDGLTAKGLVVHLTTWYSVAEINGIYDEELFECYDGLSGTNEVTEVSFYDLSSYDDRLVARASAWPMVAMLLKATGVPWS